MSSDDERIIQGFSTAFHLIQNLCKSFCCSICGFIVCFQSVANDGFRIAVILKIYKIALPVILAHEDHYTRIIQAFLGNNTFADTVNVIFQKTCETGSVGSTRPRIEDEDSLLIDAFYINSFIATTGESCC